MKRYEVFEKRKSVIDYKEKKISSKDKDFLLNILNDKPNLVNEIDLEFEFIDDGEKAYFALEDIAKYYDKKIKAPHYFALLSNNDERSCKIAGYIGEWFILKAATENIATCWLEIKNSTKAKKNLNLKSEKEIIALIAIGYGKSEYKVSSIYDNAEKMSLSALTDLGYPNINTKHYNIESRNRKSIMEFVYIDKWGEIPTLDELENRGLNEVFFYMRLAPSYTNRQPWMFIVKDTEIILTIEKNNNISEVIQCIESGIGMFYFDVAMNRIGINGVWDFEKLKEENIGEQYNIVSKYKL